YYAHPRNRFWHLMGHVIGKDLEPLEYDFRLKALLATRVGLWDVVAAATRRGSLDGAIRDAEHNPLADLVASLPALRAIGFNGSTAARIGTKLLAGSKAALVPLPSSSPAYAAMALKEKEAQWRILRKFL